MKCKAKKKTKKKPQPEALEPEHIVSAAVRAFGVVHTLPPPARHANVAREVNRELLKADEVRLVSEADDYAEGFVTNLRPFIDREEGGKVAWAADQVRPRGPKPPLNLSTMDLW